MSYLPSIQKLFRYYRSLGEKAMAQVDDAGLHIQVNEDANSIAVIVKHLAGNMLSRWTDFLTTDGEKPWRNRESEFDDSFTSRDSLIQYWNQGWDCLLAAVDSLIDADLEKIVYIRNEGHTVTEAINRQLAHVPYHVGQIVFAAKMLGQNGWESLSIPKKQSEAYNAARFSAAPDRKFFTDGMETQP